MKAVENARSKASRFFGTLKQRYQTHDDAVVEVPNPTSDPALARLPAYSGIGSNDASVVADFTVLDPALKSRSLLDHPLSDQIWSCNARCSDSNFPNGRSPKQTRFLRFIIPSSQNEFPIDDKSRQSSSHSNRFFDLCAREEIDLCVQQNIYQNYHQLHQSTAIVAEVSTRQMLFIAVSGFFTIALKIIAFTVMAFAVAFAFLLATQNPERKSRKRNLSSHRSRSLTSSTPQSTSCNITSKDRTITPLQDHITPPLPVKDIESLELYDIYKNASKSSIPLTYNPLFVFRSEELQAIISDNTQQQVIYSTNSASDTAINTLASVSSCSSTSLFNDYQHIEGCFISPLSVNEEEDKATRSTTTNNSNTKEINEQTTPQSIMPGEYLFLENEIDSEATAQATSSVEIKRVETTEDEKTDGDSDGYEGEEEEETLFHTPLRHVKEDYLMHILTSTSNAFVAASTPVPQPLTNLLASLSTEKNNKVTTTTTVRHVKSKYDIMTNVSILKERYNLNLPNENTNRDDLNSSPSTILTPTALENAFSLKQIGSPASSPSPRKNRRRGDDQHLLLSPRSPPGIHHSPRRVGGMRSHPSSPRVNLAKI